MNSGKTNPSGRKLKVQRNLISPDKNHQMAENGDNDQVEDSPSFFDENEFDEDHAVPINNNIKSSKRDQHLIQNEDF